MKRQKLRRKTYGPWYSLQKTSVDDTERSPVIWRCFFMLWSGSWFQFSGLLCCVIYFLLQLLLKKLYVRRMAADLGISRIYPSGKMIFMKTNMNKKVFRLMTEAMTSETHRNSLSFAGKEIKVRVHVSQYVISWSRWNWGKSAPVIILEYYKQSSILVVMDGIKFGIL